MAGDNYRRQRSVESSKAGMERTGRGGFPKQKLYKQSLPTGRGGSKITTEVGNAHKKGRESAGTEMSGGGSTRRQAR